MFRKYKKIIFLVCSLLITGILFLVAVKGRPSNKEELYLSDDGCLVLCYHRINKCDPVIQFLNGFAHNNELAFYTVYSTDFERQMRFLKGNGAHFITANDLDQFIHDGVCLPRKSVLITFDDVDASVYNNAFPILSKEGIPFTLFIITGHIGDENFKGLKICTTAQITEMIHSGLATVGSHSNNFHYLDKCDNPPFMLPDQQADFIKDMEESIAALKEKFKADNLYFSYPYGFGTPETDDILLDLNFRLIFTLSPGTVIADDPSFYIKRVLVHRGTWDSIVRWMETP